MKEIDSYTFRTRPDLETKAAGLEGFLITKSNFTLVFSNFEIEVDGYNNFRYMLEASEYLLCDKESNVNKIYKILDYLERNRPLINSIIDYFSNSTEK